MTPAIDIVSFTIKTKNAKYQYRFREWGAESWGFWVASIASDLEVAKENVTINRINDNHLTFSFTSKKDKYIYGSFNRNSYHINYNDKIEIGINRKEYSNFSDETIKGFNHFFEQKWINENTKLIDLTNEEEVINYILSQCNDSTITKEKIVNKLQKAMHKKIMHLLENFKLSDEYWIFNMQNNKYVSDSFKKYFIFRNEFQKNSKVDEEDYFLTDYELIQKYGIEWWRENAFTIINVLKEDLTIQELKWVSKKMCFSEFRFWKFTISNDYSIIPSFYQSNNEDDWDSKLKKAKEFRIPLTKLKNNSI